MLTRTTRSTKSTIPFGGVDVFANLQVARVDPAAFLGVEGVLRRGFNLFAVDGQLCDDLISMGDDSGNRVFVRFDASCVWIGLKVCQNTAE